MDTDLFGGSDDSDDVDSDTHIVSVSVSHETLFDILPALKGEDSTVGVRLCRVPGGNLRVCMLLVGTVSAW